MCWRNKKGSVSSIRPERVLWWWSLVFQRRPISSWGARLEYVWASGLKNLSARNAANWGNFWQMHKWRLELWQLGIKRNISSLYSAADESTVIGYNWFLTNTYTYQYALLYSKFSLLCTPNGQFYFEISSKYWRRLNFSTVINNFYNYLCDKV